ncbi:unnamed protein product [Orchesella dallaii]|uniref:procollagen-proline 4-dioxygenase n=1 Tax=Orchesella dallaii TaxID=48710 RepID=A0ABP1QNN7_9HEXA
MKSLTYLLNLILIIQLHCSYVITDMDFTYSASDLYRLVQTEQLISRNLEEAVNSLKSFHKNLEKYQTEDLKEYASDIIIKNPLLSYQLVKRHGKDLDVLDKFYEEFTAQIAELQHSYTKLRTTFTKPDKNDLQHAMEAIVRLRQTYNLTVDELSRGHVGTFRMEGYLTPADLSNIGLYAKENKMHENAKLFLAMALEQAEKANESTTLEGSWMEDAQLVLDDLNKNQSITSDREDTRLLTEMDVIFATDSLENLNKGFERLCQYHSVKEAPITKYKCYLDKTSSHMRIISPLKMEVYHNDPQIVVIYDFLSESEIEEIESATFYKLKRSVTQFFHKGSLHAEPSIIRTTAQTWIYDLGHPQFDYLGKRIASVTGYSLSGATSAEELQVASYRPGGHYSLHTDAIYEELFKDHLNPSDILMGDRIATFMIYLSDVEMGGNTAFPMLDVAVKPVKGSAILWGNLHPDGTIARYTLHGACPVIHGIKSIATKWVRANDQMFTRQKCKPSKLSFHFDFTN